MMAANAPSFQLGIVMNMPRRKFPSFYKEHFHPEQYYSDSYQKHRKDYGEKCCHCHTSFLHCKSSNFGPIMVRISILFYNLVVQLSIFYTCFAVALKIRKSTEPSF